MFIALVLPAISPADLDATSKVCSHPDLKRPVYAVISSANSPAPASMSDRRSGTISMSCQKSCDRLSNRSSIRAAASSVIRKPTCSSSVPIRLTQV